MSRRYSSGSDDIAKAVILILATVAIGAVISLLFALPVMWLWNWVIPSIFGLPYIEFWQALGLNLLCTVLFSKGGSGKS